MATVKNSALKILLASGTRHPPADDRALLIGCSSPGGFKVSSAGVPSPASITFNAILIGMTGTVNFGWSGGLSLTTNGNDAVLDYEDMGTDSGNVSISITVDGVPYSRSIAISKVFDGASGTASQLYTWIRFADSAAGAGISNDPTGKAYIGFAYNKTSATESSDPDDYAWGLFKGGDGVQGEDGADGQPTYMWVKYSDSPDGTGLYDTPLSSTVYIGISPNRTTATESTNKEDYVWSRLKGEQGVPGEAGSGARGAGAYFVEGSSWSDLVADMATPGGNVIGDRVTISSATWVMRKFWDGDSWEVDGTKIDGNLIVPGSVTTAAIDTRGLVVRAPDGTPILNSGGLLPGFEAPGTKNSEQEWADVSGRPYDVSNLVKKGSFEDGAAGTWNAFAVENIVGTPYGNPYAKQMDTRQRDCLEGGNLFPVTPGEVLHFEAWMSTINSVYDGRFGLFVRNSAGTIIDYATAIFQSAGQGWTKQRGTYTIPTGAVTAQPWVQQDGHDFTSGNWLYADDLWIGRHARGATVGAPAGTLVGTTLAQDVGSVAGAQAKANAASVLAVNAAAIAAQAKADLAETTAKAYADGIVDAEEARAIADATDKANAAEADAIAAAALDATAKANAAAVAAATYASDLAATKLNKNAADTLNGRVALQANGAFVAGDLAFDTDGNRTSGSGSGFNKNGFVHYAPDGNADVVINSAGVAVKANISGSTGTFGAVVIGSSASFGQSAYDTGNGGWIQGGATPKFSMRAANGKYIRIDVAAGIFDFNGLSLTGATLTAPVLDTFTAYISGAAGGSFSNGSAGYGTLTVVSAGGRGAKTHKWWLVLVNKTGNAGAMLLDSPDSASTGISGSGTNATLEYEAFVTVTDENQRSITLSMGVIANHGTPP